MELFSKGQKITIFFQKDLNMVEITCEIDLLHNDRIELILPQYFMRYIEYLQVGNQITAKAFTKMGTIDFNSVIISSPLEECFSIELDYNSLNLIPGSDVPYIEAIEPLELFNNNNILKLKTIQISTEYVKFTSSTILETGKSYDCTLILPKDYGIINFKATVVEVDQIYDDEYTAVYDTMTEAARQNLLYYMYMYSSNSD